MQLKASGSLTPVLVEESCPDSVFRVSTVPGWFENYWTLVVTCSFSFVSYFSKDGKVSYLLHRKNGLMAVKSKCSTSSLGPIGLASVPMPCRVHIF